MGATKHPKYALRITDKETFDKVYQASLDSEEYYPSSLLSSNYRNGSWGSRGWVRTSSSDPARVVAVDTKGNDWTEVIIQKFLEMLRGEEVVVDEYDIF